MVALAFNPDEVEDDGGGNFAPIPAGIYAAQVTGSDLVETKSGNGQMLKLTFEITEGPCARRLVWAQLNIVHPNAQAQAIAHRDLKRLCDAVGHEGVLSDSADLEFKPLRIRVAVKSDPQYGDKNEVRGFMPYADHAPTAASPPARSAPAQARSAAPPPKAAAAGGRSAPWR